MSKKIKQMLPNEALKGIIEEGMKEMLSYPEICSVSLGIVNNGQKSTFHMGELTKGQGDTATDDTIFELGSVSKTFAGTLAAKAVLEGKMNLEDDIRKYLPQTYDNFEFEGTPIQIKHLMTHSSRLPHFISPELEEMFKNKNNNTPLQFHDFMSKYTREEFLRDLHDIKLESKAGSRYSYSNVGVEILGYILESINGKTISELLKENFADLYGMKHTKLFLDENEQKHLTAGYWKNSDMQVPHFTTLLWGTSGFLYSTLPDMLRFIELQLDTTNEIITESHKVLYQNGRDRFGYMWRVIDDEDDGIVYLHHGQTHSMQNWIYFNQHRNFGLSIITNQSGMRTGGYLNRLSNKIVAHGKKRSFLEKSYFVASSKINQLKSKITGR